MTNRKKGQPRAKVQVPEGGWRPKAAETKTISTAHVPRKQFTPVEPEGKLVILFSRVDVDGPWCLTRITSYHHRVLLNKVRDLETMTVHEVFHRDGSFGKDYNPGDLPNPLAKKRLAELEYDDRDLISRLEIGAKPRLYGFREAERFYALWWDPDHEIWPSSLRHT